MNQLNAVPFAEKALNTASSMIHDVAGPGNNPRNLDSTMAAAVLNAQSNLAIAAALMAVAQAIGRRNS